MSDYSADNRPPSTSPAPFPPLSPSKASDEAGSSSAAQSPKPPGSPPLGEPKSSLPTTPPFGSGAVQGNEVPAKEEVSRDDSKDANREPVNKVSSESRPPASEPVERPPAAATNGGGGSQPAEVKGRIEVADEVVEKVAALAALEVPGVADLGGDIERAIESVRERIGVGQRRGDQGVKAQITGRDVAVTVVIMIEYGHVVMDVAHQVKNNVARQTNRMLGLRVVEVNVTVDDVKIPEAPKQGDSDDQLVSLEG